MKTFKIGDTVKDVKIKMILWSEKDNRETFYSKSEVLYGARYWCIFLLENGLWIEGKWIVR